MPDSDLHLPNEFCLQAALKFLPPQGEGPQRFRMEAYDGGLLRLANAPYPVVVDLKGMQQVDQVKALLHHDAARPAGHMDRVQIGETIVTEGVLSVEKNAAEIQAAQKGGFRWEASIGATIEDGARELIPAGRSVEVNGRTFRGPVIVARKTLLREVSFTGSGAGTNTSARIVAAATPTTYEAFQMPEPAKIETENKEVTQADLQKELTEIRELKASWSSERDEAKKQREQLQSEREALQRDRLVDSVDRLVAQYGNPGDDITASLKDKAKSGAVSESEIELTILRAAGSHKFAGFMPIGGKKGAPANQHVIEAALCLTNSWSEEELGKHFDEKTINAALENRWSGFGPRALFIESLHAHGHHVIGGRLQDEDIQVAVHHAEQEMIQASGGSSTISVPGILSNVARKELLRTFDTFTQCITRIAKVSTATDYKPYYMYRLSTGALMEQVGADGELKSMELSEDEFQARVYPFGRKITLNNVQIRNDDMGAFSDMARAFALMAVRTQEYTGFKTLLSQQGTFWTTAKGNRIADAAGAKLGIDSLGSAYQLFLQMKDFTGQFIGMEPKYLTVSPTDKVLAGKLFKDSQINLGVAGDTDTIVERLSSNQWQGMFQPLWSPYLSNGAVPNANGTQWLLSADPNMTAPIVVSYLDGRRTPQVKTWEAIPGKMGMQWDATYNIGFSLHDDTGSVFSKGQA